MRSTAPAHTVHERASASHEPAAADPTERAMEPGEPEPLQPLPPSEPEPPEPSSDGPALHLHTVARGADAIVTITNETHETVTFDSELFLERFEDENDRWGPVRDRGRFFARVDARRASPRCARLAPGSSLEVTAASLAGVDCEACGPPSRGVYRFLLQSCDRRGRTEGDAFRITP